MARKKKASTRKTAAATPRKQPPPMFYSPNMVRQANGGMIRRTAQTLGGGSGAGATASGAAQSVAQSPLFYNYQWSTPDKFYYPKNRVVANSIWREIYKRDPAIATATDMYAELPWSEFSLIGIDDPHVKRVYEEMFNVLNLPAKLPAFTRDFLITGELVLHAIFDSTRGIWERIIPHNPDYIRVEGVGLAIDQPLLWLLPTPEIKRLLNSTDPFIRKLQEAIPPKILNSFRMNREVKLDELNTTYIPRLNSSTDIRGTSLYSRLYRIVMYEDFIVNASLAVAQRNAVPLRIFKLGDPNSGWIPDEETEAAFAEMLSMAEADPLAAIIMHHNVSAELVGVTDRMLLISREWDFIERVKLLALGVSKSFLVGEASFASAVAGLQTLMERCEALRSRFEQDWIIKKLCEPIAQIHEFYRTTKAQLDHRIRVKRPLDDAELIIPKIKWKKSLESNQDVSILNIWRDLRERGILSERTYGAGAGVDIDIERKNLLEERKYKEEHPELYGAPAMPGQPPGGARPPAGPGAKPPAALPAPPGASLQKKARMQNPYVDETSYRNYIDQLEDKLEDIAGSDNRVDITDVVSAVQELDDDILEEQKVVERLPHAGNDLLSGI